MCSCIFLLPPMNLCNQSAVKADSRDLPPLSDHAPLRGELADVLSQYSLSESLRGLRLLVLDAQLRQLLADEPVLQMEALIEHLGAAIALAEMLRLPVPRDQSSLELPVDG
jgi:hypothetical protein